MTDNIVAEVAKRLNRADDIALYCHTNPDGDALGSMLALYVALKRKGKTVYAYCDSAIPPKFQTMFAVENVTFPQKLVHSLAVSVDSSSLDRLGQCMRSFLSAREQIAIDHHKTFSKFAGLCLVDCLVASCCEVVYSVLKEMKCIDKEVASLLFSGIVTDSACFSFSSVSSKTFDIASSLLAYGIDNGKLVYDYFRAMSAQKFKLKSRVMSKAKFSNDNRIAIITIDKSDFAETNTAEDDSEGLINEIINVDSVQIAYSLAEVGTHRFKVSIRTKGDIDASEIANVFGGGGHFYASGCRINGYKEDIIERLIKIARDRLPYTV